MSYLRRVVVRHLPDGLRHRERVLWDPPSGAEAWTGWDDATLGAALSLILSGETAPWRDIPGPAGIAVRALERAAWRWAAAAADDGDLAIVE